MGVAAGLAGGRGFLETAGPPLRHGIRALLAFEVLWRLLLFLGVGPLSLALLNALLQQSGQPAITNLGLVSFAVSPLGWLALVLGATFCLTLNALETAGLLLIVLRRVRGRDVTARQALRFTMARLPALVGVALAQVLLGLLAALPFAAMAGLLWWLLLSGSDINYYLARRPPAFLLATGAGAILGLGLLGALGFLYLRWLFAVPVCLFEAKTGFTALRASAGLIHGQYARLLAWLAAWQLLRAVVLGITLYGLQSLNRVLLGADIDTDNLIVPTIGCLALDGAILFLLSIADGIGFALLIAFHFEDLYRRRGSALADELFIQELPVPPTSRLLRLVATGGLAVLAASVLGHAALLADQFAAHRSVSITAHRAGAGSGPENTLAALRQAITDGADRAEIDVQETADGVVVVLHDKDLRRLTGDPRNIWDVTAAELRELRISQGAQGPPERIATLAEFLEAARGRIQLNIELKYNGHDQRLAERVVELLRQHDFLDQAVITSLDYRGLQEVRRLEPRLRTGLIVSARLGDLTQLDVDFLSVRDGLVTPALRRQTCERGWELHVWNVNERAKLAAMLDHDVDNIITDNVLLTREVLRERAAVPDAVLILHRLHAWMRSGRGLSRT